MKFHLFMLGVQNSLKSKFIAVYTKYVIFFYLLKFQGNHVKYHQYKCMLYLLLVPEFHHLKFYKNVLNGFTKLRQTLILEQKFH